MTIFLIGLAGLLVGYVTTDRALHLAAQVKANKSRRQYDLQAKQVRLWL